MDIVLNLIMYIFFKTVHSINNSFPPKRAKIAIVAAESMAKWSILPPPNYLASGDCGPPPTFLVPSVSLSIVLVHINN